MKKNLLDNTIVKEDMNIIYTSIKGIEQLKNTKILVTGAYGMLASYLVYFFIFLNEFHNFSIDIWIIVRNKEKLEKRYGNICEKEYFHYVMQTLDSEIRISEKMDYIIHAASLASPQYYNTIPVEVMLPNVIGTYHLLEFAKKCKTKNFLFFSSSEIYGKQDETISKNYDETVLGILDPMDIRNCYAESKRMGENMCVGYFREYGIKTNSVRIFHTFGPTMDIHHDERAFSEFVANIIDKKNIEMKSEGKAKRAFCYITDAILGFLLILLYGSSGETYNLCNDLQYISISELAKILVKLFPERNLKVKKVTRSIESTYVSKKDENLITADSNKLRQIGWCPQITIKEGFFRTIKAIEEGM
ncbi:NAD-dependent epimerase/dehydratase family protein [Mediterraneibacter agrestimuris]|uniref:NAD-dependent epimerase/dehydratase family protein n=1 Tax=Mediterraneibacter agrestimuris TaxID=2941333 RepID=UPI00203D3833|nr:NAD-dependent epimerase/dehydratase family protein [Mediterraneibacter agrestimuris]